MRTILVFRDGVTRPAEAVDPTWLASGAPEIFWLDIRQPADEDRRLLLDVFHFHELAVEDAMAEVHHPKIESYGTFLYLILHAVWTVQDESEFQSQDIDFFVGRNFLVTVHGVPSSSIETQQRVCGRHNEVLSEGPVALLHRIVDHMIDLYRPWVDGLELRLEKIERTVFENPNRNPLKQILALKGDVASLRRVALPQRDAIARLARREFPEIGEVLAYRFRDVYDHLVRMVDETAFSQDRVTGLLEAYLSTQSNRMNQVMKVLTVISTIFMPLTVLTSMWGMNVPLPHLPGGEGMQFWWVLAVMLVSTGSMLYFFRKMDWL